jgi:hypothetical protein
MRRFHLEGLAFILPLWLFGPFLFSSSLFNETAPLHFEYAEKRWFFENLAQGNWTFLYPFNELGHGLLNNPASGLVFLPNWLHALLPYHLAYKLIFYGFFLVLFFGLRRLLLNFTNREQASGIALVGMSLGIITSLPIHVGLGYMSFFPWTIVSVMELWKGERRIVLTAFCSSALFLLGDPFLIPVAWLAASALAFERRRVRIFSLAMLQVTALVGLVCLPHLWFMLQNAPFNSRALGIVTSEALSYSTAPVRMFDWLFPAANLYDLKKYLGDGFNVSWWFPRIGGGVALTALMFLGVKQASPRERGVLVAWTCGFALLSLGQFFPPAAFVMELLPIRYPERFLAYLVPAILILVALGLRRLPGKWVLPLLAFALLENSFFPRRPDLIEVKESGVPSEIWIGEEMHQTRYLSCPDGLAGTEQSRLFDVRAQQIPMVNGTSNTRSAALKVVSCPWALSPHVQQWLGIGHVLSSGEHGEGQKWGLSKVGSMPKGEIFQASASPWMATGVEKFETSRFITALPPSAQDVGRMELFAKEGRFFVDPQWSLVDGAPKRGVVQDMIPWSCSRESLSLVPTFFQQTFIIKLPANCQGLLNVPWAFQAGWVTEPSSEILRLNDGTLGLQVPLGLHELQLAYRPRGAVAMVVFSILLQLVILATIVVGFFKKRNP